MPRKELPTCNAVAANGRVTAVHQSVERFLAARPPRPSLVLLDPPRTGLSPEAADEVIRLAADRVVYVSCDVATLARDARRLVDAGYTLERLNAFDLFPNTPHVETVAVFERSVRSAVRSVRLQPDRETPSNNSTIEY